MDKEDFKNIEDLEFGDLPPLIIPLVKLE